MTNCYQTRAMHQEPTLLPLRPSADVVEVGWRSRWSPLTERARHLLELIYERDLDRSEIECLEAEIHRLGLSGPVKATGETELFDRLALGELTEAPILLDPSQAHALGELLISLCFLFGFEGQVEPWGVDWVLPELQLRVYLVEIGDAERPAYFEIIRL